MRAKYSLYSELSPRPILDSRMPESFQAFASQEQRAWADSESTPEYGTNLVQPTGSLDALLAHHLHQPSLATVMPPGTDVADRTNVSISMIMGNAYREGNTLIYDQLHRRSKASDGLSCYPAKVVQAHEDFTYQLMESSAAKVEVVYGKPVQTNHQKAENDHYSSLGTLCGHFSFPCSQREFYESDPEFHVPKGPPVRRTSAANALRSKGEHRIRPAGQNT
jgi:hypothetical protein